MDDRLKQVVCQGGAFFLHLQSLIYLMLSVILIVLRLSSHHDYCDKQETSFRLGIWVGTLVMCCLWLLGTLKNIPILLWMYLIILGSVIIAVIFYSVTGFILMSQSTGHHVDGLRFKEYQLQDYSSWIIKKINNSHSWENYYKKCYPETYNCSHLSEIYKTREEYQRAKLDPIEAGCCRPPSKCGYPVIDASYYNLSFPPISSHKDCKLYENSKAIKCLDCESCKAGVAQELKSEWIFQAIMIAPVSLFLLFALCQGCLVIRNFKKVYRKEIHPDDEIVQREV